MTDAVHGAWWRTGARVPIAVLRARLHLVVRPCALRRIGTAVPPGVSLQRPPNRQCARPRVQVRPLQPQRLTTAQTEGKRESEPHAVTPLFGRLQNPLSLFDRERLYLGLRRLGRLHQQNRIPSEVPTPNSFVQRDTQRAVNLL
ncbi:hypothetical protein [Saccharothrix luteola]|uniref:hypothetical protein n=1 Tax=Saccharothrix luteola TaxID=2893018 RepID=UPI001E3A54E3|nr:hypothetical protein [Saccharothrix luteola]MCC8247411.1 hypothetical protein [Saccharothrix luteola]